jgi:hypothetical protein
MNTTYYKMRENCENLPSNLMASIENADRDHRYEMQKLGQEENHERSIGLMSFDQEGEASRNQQQNQHARNKTVSNFSGNFMPNLNTHSFRENP